MGRQAGDGGGVRRDGQLFFFFASLSREKKVHGDGELETGWDLLLFCYCQERPKLKATQERREKLSPLRCMKRWEVSCRFLDASTFWASDERAVKNKFKVGRWVSLTVSSYPAHKLS